MRGKASLILRRLAAGLLGVAAGAVPSAALAQLTASNSAVSQAGGSITTVVERVLSGDMSAVLVVDADLDRDLLRSFYQERSYQPLWLAGGEPRTEARQLLEALQNARAEGLLPANYHAREIADLLAHSSPERLAFADLLLSQALAAYATDLRFGRTQPAISYTAPELAPERIAPADMLRRAANAPDLSAFLDDLHVHNPIYARLRQALVRERQRAHSAPTLQAVQIANGDTLRTGDRDPRVVQLRQRLAIGSGASPQLYDARVEQAVRAFQQRQGLDADGVLGPNTLAALNRSSEDRIRTIVANMERARWLPRDLGERFLLVDIAGFELGLFEGGTEIDRMKVVVGKQQQRTPMFADKMEYVVVNPYWNIPESIVREEVAPAVRREGAAYLRRKNMEVLSGWGNSARVVRASSVNWAAAARGDVRFRVRQRPGPANALGRIKFMFPNKYAVYLHDTPADHLFDRNQRMFSHGCVRVERPVDLAGFVFATTKGWDAQRLTEAIGSGKRQTIHLARALPVYLTYFTAWPRSDGTVAFRPDIYGRDEDLKAELSADG